MTAITELLISLELAVELLARITLIVARSSGAALAPNKGLNTTEFRIILSLNIL